MEKIQLMTADGEDIPPTDKALWDSLLAQLNQALEVRTAGEPFHRSQLDPHDGAPPPCPLLPQASQVQDLTVEDLLDEDDEPQQGAGQEGDEEEEEEDQAGPNSFSAETIKDLLNDLGMDGEGLVSTPAFTWCAVRVRSLSSPRHRPPCCPPPPDFFHPTLPPRPSASPPPCPLPSCPAGRCR
jgi:hypothetical protein